jgi:hypothetical protein
VEKGVALRRFATLENLTNWVNETDRESIKSRDFNYDKKLSEEFGQETYVDDKGIQALSEDDNLLLENMIVEDKTDAELIAAAEKIAQRVDPKCEGISLTEDDFMGELEKDKITGEHNEEGIKKHLAKMGVLVVVDEVCQYKGQIVDMIKEMVVKINNQKKINEEESKKTWKEFCKENEISDADCSDILIKMESGDSDTKVLEYLKEKIKDKKESGAGGINLNR